MAVCCRRLLIVEDEPLLRISMADALEKEGWNVDVAEDGERGIALFNQHHHEVVITDLVMQRMGGMDLLRRIKSTQPDATVLIITAHGSVERAVEAMREGAADFITKPFSVAQLLVRLDAVCSVRLLREQNLRLQEQLERRYSFSKIVGRSKKMHEVFELIRVVADSNTSVVVCGESGTGKEMVASAIHFNSGRRSKPYVRVSCASLPESLIESELFGYEKGAFTGATQRRVGRFEAASGGTLFLDEISELPLSFQVKLLRVLQEHQIERLGSNRPINVDVRVVSACQRPLEQEVLEGTVREDLMFRMNTITIQLPPLRERREDVPLLAQTFLAELNRERGKGVDGFDDDVLEIFDAYPWPGNVRELKNVVERAFLFSHGGKITPDELPAGLRTGGPVVHGGTRNPAEVQTLQQAVERAEVEAIKAALVSTKGKRAEAAEVLGVSRKTLWEKIKNYAIPVDP